MPLSSLHVLSVAVNLPGPVATRALQEAGAQVTTILPPGGDPMNSYSPTLFDALHEGQELLTLDLRSDAGRARAHELLARADVLITSSRPQALVRMGMDFRTTSALNPRLCQVDIVGFPGADADRPGHDLTYQADQGLVDRQLPRTLVSDMAGGQQAAFEALSGVMLVEATGRPVHRRVALSQAAAFMALPLTHGLTGPGQLLGGGDPCYDVYETSDGSVALAALEPHFRERVEKVAGTTARDGLREHFLAHPTAYWVEWAAEHDIPLSACQR